MPDLVTISSFLGSLKTATEIAKWLKDSTVTIEQAETKLKLAELIGALADAKLEVAEIQELLLEKDKRIKELEDFQEIRNKMIWRDSVYYQKSDEGEDGPYCPQCYDSNKKVIRLQNYGTGHWHCMTCDKSFYSNTYKSSGSSVARTDYDPFSL